MRAHVVGCEAHERTRLGRGQLERGKVERGATTNTCAWFDFTMSCGVVASLDLHDFHFKSLSELKRSSISSLKP
jgi:hypothetical protein